jgi:hypothetical protein
MPAVNQTIYHHSQSHTAIRAVLTMSSYLCTVRCSTPYHYYFSWVEVVQNNLRLVPCCSDIQSDSQLIALGGDLYCGEGRGSCHNRQSTHSLQVNLTVSASGVGSSSAAGSPFHYSFSRRGNELLTTQL